MVKRTLGFACPNRTVSCAATVSAVGMTASRRSPESPCRTARISSRSVRASPTIRRAQPSTRCPSGVSPRNRDPRQISSTPSCPSSCLIPADSVGWVIPRLSAARPKCSSRATAISISSLSITAAASVR